MITQIIRCKLDVGKIDKMGLFKSPKTGKTYLNITVMLKDEKGKYGDDGFVVQSMNNPDDKGQVLGDARIVERKGNQPQQQQAKPSVSVPDGWDDPADSIPF